MTDLPHNPTKTDLLEQNWYDFLLFIKNGSREEVETANKVITHSGYETAF